MTAQYLTPNQAKVVYETIDGEVIIINLESGSYYSIVGTGAILWAFIASGVTLEALQEAAAGTFSGDAATIQDGVNSFIDELLAEEILTLASGIGSGQTAALSEQPAGGVFTTPALTIHTNMSDLLLLDPIHDVDEQGWPSQRPE